MAGGGGGGLAVLGRQPRRVAGEVVAARQGGAVALLGRGAAEAVGLQEELGDVGAAGYPGQLWVGGAEQGSGVQAWWSAKRRRSAMAAAVIGSWP